MQVKTKRWKSVAFAGAAVFLLQGIEAPAFAQDSSASEELEIPLFLLEAASEHGQTFAARTPIDGLSRIASRGGLAVGLAARLKDGAPVLEATTGAVFSSIAGTAGYRVCGLAAATALCVPANIGTPLGYGACVIAVSTACLYGGQVLGNDFARQVSAGVRSAYNTTHEYISAIDSSARSQSHTAWIRREIDAIRDYSLSNLNGSGVSANELIITPIQLSPQDPVANEYVVFTESMLFCGSAGCPIQIYQMRHGNFTPQLLLSTFCFNVSAASAVEDRFGLVPIRLGCRQSYANYYYNGSEYELGETYETPIGSNWGDWRLDTTGLPSASVSYADEWKLISFSLVCAENSQIRFSASTFAGGAYPEDHVFLSFANHHVAWQAELQPAPTAAVLPDSRTTLSIVAVPDPVLEALKTELFVEIYSDLHRGSVPLNNSAAAITRLEASCGRIQSGTPTRNISTTDTNATPSTNTTDPEALLGEWISTQPNRTLDAFGTASRQMLFTDDGRIGLLTRSTGTIGRHLTANAPITWGRYEVSEEFIIVTLPGSDAFSPPDVRRSRYRFQGDILIMDELMFRRF